jgi:hypothetical protein
MLTTCNCGNMTTTTRSVTIYYILPVPSTCAKQTQRQRRKEKQKSESNAIFYYGIFCSLYSKHLAETRTGLEEEWRTKSLLFFFAVVLRKGRILVRSEELFKIHRRSQVGRVIRSSLSIDDEIMRKGQKQKRR